MAKGPSRKVYVKLFLSAFFPFHAKGIYTYAANYKSPTDIFQNFCQASSSLDVTIFSTSPSYIPAKGLSGGPAEKGLKGEDLLTSIASTRAAAKAGDAYSSAKLRLSVRFAVSLVDTVQTFASMTVATIFR